MGEVGWEGDGLVGAGAGEVGEKSPVGGTEVGVGLDGVTAVTDSPEGE